MQGLLSDMGKDRTWGGDDGVCSSVEQGRWMERWGTYSGRASWEMVNFLWVFFSSYWL